jgi:hypothetical protein
MEIYDSFKIIILMFTQKMYRIENNLLNSNHDCHSFCKEANVFKIPFYPDD